MSVEEKMKEENQRIIKKANTIITVFGVLMAVLVATVFICYYYFTNLGNEQQMIITNITIQSEIGKDKADENYVTKYLYMVKTQSGQTLVLENEDEIFIGKFNSSDFLAKLKEYERSGQVFKVKTIGRRIGFFNSYQNIIWVGE